MSTLVLARPRGAINVGLEVFADGLAAEGVPVVHVDWRPPAGAEGMAALLARLEDDDDE